MTTSISKFYIVDSGKEMLPIADKLMKDFKVEGHHYLNYLTDQDYYLAVEEVNEDVFLDHVKANNL